MPSLDPNQRKRYRRKSRKLATRDLRQPRARANRQIGRIEDRTASRVAGVHRGYQRQSAAIGGTSLKGLGRYKGQVQQEIAASQRGLATVERHHARQVQREGNQAVRAIRQPLREEALSLAAGYFEDLRTQAAERKATRTIARREVQHYLSRIPEDQLGVLHIQKTRDALAADVAKADGITIQDARAEVERLYRRLRDQLPSPVLSDAERRAASRPTR